MNLRIIKNKIKLFIRVIIGKELFEKVYFHREVGYWPDIKTPDTFCEHISYLKLYDKNPLYVEVSDKYAVREYVGQRIGKEYLSRIYGVLGNSIDLSVDLPDSFVVKASYGSGINYFVENYSPDKREKILIQIEKMLRTRHLYGELSGQWWYKGISRRLIIEERIYDKVYDIPIDYKFYCFRGEPCYIQVDSDRFGDHTRTFYDCSWNKQDFTFTYSPAERLPVPGKLEEMIVLSKELSKDFDFIRVDFYNPTDSDRIIFGELTLAPQAGWIRFVPDHMVTDLLLGKLWPKIKNGNTK